mmetsp:Transcript_977/g.1751  ORF Transcript_977/g.1751 Transcript_977/m.1751 type:complete len:120 (-) Transcript_977:124-483(-)
MPYFFSARRHSEVELIDSSLGCLSLFDLPPHWLALIILLHLLSVVVAMFMMAVRMAMGQCMTLPVLLLSLNLIASLLLLEAIGVNSPTSLYFIGDLEVPMILVVVMLLFYELVLLISAN